MLACRFPKIVYIEHVGVGRHPDVYTGVISAVGVLNVVRRAQMDPRLVDVTGPDIGWIPKAAVLMGCKIIISGISPAIAQTITELGIDMGAVCTTSTIESALREAITGNGGPPGPTASGR